jgi:hypothetical protein
MQVEESTNVNITTNVTVNKVESVPESPGESPMQNTVCLFFRKLDVIFRVV